MPFIQVNILEGRTRHIRWDELKACDPKTTFLVDVRTPDEFGAQVGRSGKAVRSWIRGDARPHPYTEPKVLSTLAELEAAAGYWAEIGRAHV